MDVALVEYDVELITESGTAYDLDNALIALAWEEQEGQLAQKATVTVANVKTGSGYLMSLAKLNCMIRIYAHWGAGRQKMFEGNIWEWNYTSAQTKELALTVYDPMIRLQQCSGASAGIGAFRWPTSGASKSPTKRRCSMGRRSATS